MRRVRIRKGLGAILFIGVVLALLYLPQIVVHDTSNYSNIVPPSTRYDPAAGGGGDDGDGGNDQAAAQVLNHDATTCRPIRNVAFVKTHKAGSSTIANILQRFGLTYNLSFALPRKKINTHGYNYIVRPGEIFTPEKLIPLPVGKSYNVLWSHSIYNRTAFHNVMPKDTAYISILREPFQQFVSSFDYYGVIKTMYKLYPSITNESNPVSTFLQSRTFTRLFSGRTHYSYLRNKQAQDFGFRETEYTNESKRLDYIKDLERDFSFVMIMEHFDESLLILKHKLCWHMKDILYIPKNRNAHKPNRTFTPSDHEKHQAYSPVDYSLYQRFYSLYSDTINSQEEDFFIELVHFKSLLRQVKENCLHKRPFAILVSPWHESFQIDSADCKLMLMPELEGLHKLLARMNYPTMSMPPVQRKPWII